MSFCNKDKEILKRSRTPIRKTLDSELQKIFKDNKKLISNQEKLMLFKMKRIKPIEIPYKDLSLNAVESYQREKFNERLDLNTNRIINIPNHDLIQECGLKSHSSPKSPNRRNPFFKPCISFRKAKPICSTWKPANETLKQSLKKKRRVSNSKSKIKSFRISSKVLGPRSSTSFTDYKNHYQCQNWQFLPL